MVDLTAVIGDLAGEHQALDDLLHAGADADLSLPTPAPGWTVTDTLGHLTYFDHTAALAATDSEAFASSMRELFAGASEVGLDEFTLGAFRTLDRVDQVEAWRAGRQRLLEAARQMDPDTRVPWYGPSMSATSFVTARLMECWAHGVDIEDALGRRREPSDRLVHVVRLGVITRGWSYSVRGEQAPETEMAVVLQAPSGATWAFVGRDSLNGPAPTLEELAGREYVVGSALDFALVVTQRRHVDDTSLVTSQLGRHWMERAQAFAGGPTVGPPAGGR